MVIMAESTEFREIIDVCWQSNVHLQDVKRRNITLLAHYTAAIRHRQDLVRGGAEIETQKA